MGLPRMDSGERSGSGGGGPGVTLSDDRVQPKTATAVEQLATEGILAIDGLLVAAVSGELGTLPGEIIGIGPVNAAIGTMRQLQARRPAWVVLVGTCGAYTKDIPIGTVIVGEVLGWACPGVVADVAYGVADPAPVASDADLRRRFPARGARVWTTPAITTDGAVVDALSRIADVEHLETWAVARACAELCVPFVPVLGVSNHVGPDAHAEWVAHRGKAEEAARAVVRAGLGLGG